MKTLSKNLFVGLAVAIFFVLGFLGHASAYTLNPISTNYPSLHDQWVPNGGDVDISASLWSRYDLDSFELLVDAHSQGRMYCYYLDYL